MTSESVFDSLQTLFTLGGEAMWAIAACSVLAGAVFFDRYFALRRARRDVAAFSEPVSAAGKTPGCTLALAHIADLCRFVPESALLQFSEEACDEAAEREERGIALLSLLARLTPMLGLLGTVVGMIDVFRSMPQGGASAPGLADGIWKALLTTVAGLVVAVPAMLGHEYLANRAALLRQEIREKARLLLLDAFRARSRGTGP